MLISLRIIQHFSTLYHKRHDLGGGGLLNIEFVFWFSVQLLSEAVLILRIQRYIVTNVCRSWCILHVVVVGLKWNLNFVLTDFRKIFRCQFSCKPVQWVEFHAEGQTDKAKVIVAFAVLRACLKMSCALRRSDTLPSGLSYTRCVVDR